MTKSCSADALDSRRRVRIGNEPLVSKADTWPRSGRKGTFLTALKLELIQICLQGILTHRRVGGVVVDIERFVLPACADRVRLTS